MLSPSTPRNPASPAAPRRSERRFSEALSFRPYGLVGSSWEGAVTGAFTVALIVIFGADMAIPAPIEITALALIVVIASSWLLSTVAAAWVAGSAITLLGVDAAAGGIPIATAGAEAAVFSAVAISSRLYASRLRIVLEGSDADKASVASTVFGLQNLAHLIDASADGVAAVDTEGRVRYANAAAIELLGLPPASGRQLNLIDCIARDDRIRVMSQLASSVDGGPTTLEFRAGCHEAELRDLECVHTQVRMRGQRLNCLVMWDTTEIKRLQLTANALAETAAGLAVTQPLEEMLAAIARRVIEVTDACACAVFLVDGPRSLRLAASSGLPPGYGAAANAAIESGADPPVFQAIRTGRPVFVEDLPGRIRTQDDMAPMRPLVAEVRWRQAIAFPMIHAGRPVGGLCVYLRPEQSLDEPTMDFLSTIASQAASAAQVSRLVTVAQDEVAAQERSRLSRELHDSLTQELYGIALGAKSARARIGAEAFSLIEPLDYILELAEAGLADMRRLVLELRPEPLPKEGLMTAVRDLAHAISERHGLKVITDLPSEPQIPADVKLLAYRITQEAVHNVIKHAHAKHVWIHVTVDDSAVTIDVIDDGTGFDSTVSFPGHFGLASMRERAESRGGSIAFGRSPEGGTTVHVRLPCQMQPAIVAASG